MKKLLSKNGKKIAVSAAATTLLIVAFIFGGNGNDGGKSVRSYTDSSLSQTVTADSIGSDSLSEASSVLTAAKTTTASTTTKSVAATSSQAETAASASTNQSTTVAVKSTTASKAVKQSSVATQSSAATTAATTTTATTTVTVQSTDEEKSELICTISISCETILDNLDKLSESQRQIVPKDGIILNAQTAEFEDGESVYDVLCRVCRGNGIHMESSNSPVYNSAYIEGIANIYEFDAGSLSGWMYSVNGVFPDVGCSAYKLSDGDTVEFVYTCNLGKDVGE